MGLNPTPGAYVVFLRTGGPLGEGAGIRHAITVRDTSSLLQIVELILPLAGGGA